MRSKNDSAQTMPEGYDLSQRIIDNYRLSTQPVRTDYLDYLAQKSITWADELEQKRESQKKSPNVENDTKAIVDRVFAVLEAYVLELNKVSRVRDLLVTTTAPSRSQEVLEFDRARQPIKSLIVYRTRFSTSRLSLVVRGIGSRVEFFLMPCDRVMGLYRAEAEVGALMVFDSEPSLAGLSWTVEGKPLSTDRLERYSLLALEHLLDKTREEVG
jgi:hypothetical protein